MQTSTEAHPFGQTSGGETADLFVLGSKLLRVAITNHGARIVSLFAPDRNGHHEDIVLGYKSLAEYEKDKRQYFGATIGRFANRIANGRFKVEGKQYEVPPNNGTNALHGGPEGFDLRLWQAAFVPDGIEMSLVSADGDMGFPGTLSVWVRYLLRGSDLILEYGARTSEATIVNLTNHSYFNLAGESSGTVLSQQICINADRYLPVTQSLIPTGALESVDSSPFDLRHAVAIGDGLSSRHVQIEMAGGYDHNFVLKDSASNHPRFAARVADPGTGRAMAIATTEPGVQFYSGNFLDGSVINKTGGFYVRNSGFCLETQHFPDSPNQPHFPSTLLTPDRQFLSTTIFTFGVDA